MKYNEFILRLEKSIYVNSKGRKESYAKPVTKGIFNCDLKNPLKTF